MEIERLITSELLKKAKKPMFKIIRNMENTFEMCFITTNVII